MSPGHTSVTTNPGSSSGGGGGGGGGAVPPVSGWNLIMNEDFNTNCSEGHFLSTYADFDAYEDGTPDTYAIANGGGSQYSTEFISVASSIMTVRVHADSSGSYGAALIPIFPGKSSYQGYAGYRSEMKVRCLSPVAWQKEALLKWSDLDNWNLGEMDFFENNLNGNIEGFNHWPGNPSSQDSCSTSTKISDGWHICTVEWIAGTSLTYYLDGTAVGTFTSHIATASFHDVIQIERQLSRTPAPVSGQTCNWDLDYYRAWTPA